MVYEQRLAALRDELSQRGLDGFLIPLSDEYQNEYVPESAQRLAWLTGFGGSAGFAAVLADQAAIFVDGRYTLQVRDQVDVNLYTPRHVSDEPLRTWLIEVFPKGGKLGFDPWLHSEAQKRQLETWTNAAGGHLVAVDKNPVDAVWLDRPAPPEAPIKAHPMSYTGQSSEAKRAALGTGLQEKGVDSAVLTAPDSIAWLLNVRGGDVACTPLPLSFALLYDDGGVEWFVSRSKVDEELESELEAGISILPPEEFGDSLDGLGKRKVLADPGATASWVFSRLRAAGAEIVEASDPCQLPKARKNSVELDGIRKAHRRDGASLTRFLAWLDGEAPRRAAAEGGNAGVTELEAAEKLAELRQENAEFRDFSFDTIAGSGPNGAIVHYRVTPETNRPLGLGELFLCDSGAQYPDGTTDVTRTMAVGEPTEEMRERFTLVLKGHITLATCRFPKGTTGSQLDAFARHPLWQQGLDYDHGTGHGVGSYLSVHEGPQRISKLPNSVALEPGMICSNEPGYYKTGEYGIRIENLVTVMEDEKRPGDEKDMLAFETLTFAPLDRRLIKTEMLTADEVAWLDAYHARVRETLSDNVDADTKPWLDAATAPLAGV